MPYSKLALCLAVLGGSLLSCRPADSERSAGDSFMHSSEFPPLSRLVHLDAEALAEGGIRDAYVRLKPELAKHIAQPADLEQILPNDGTRYSILCLGREHVVWGGGFDPEDSWARATFVFFAIVNEQLADTSSRFYALNGGNDLEGVWLSEAEFARWRREVSKKREWPYLPTEQGPWYGQPH